MRKAKKRGPLEDRARRIVKARLKRGEREMVAQAAGDHLGPWLSGWLAGRQDATLDEIARMAKALRLSLPRLLGASVDDDALLAALSAEESAADVRAFLGMPPELRPTVLSLASVVATYQPPGLSAEQQRAQPQGTRTKSAGGRRQ